MHLHAMSARNTQQRYNEPLVCNARRSSLWKGHPITFSFTKRTDLTPHARWKLKELSANVVKGLSPNRMQTILHTYHVVFSCGSRPLP